MNESPFFISSSQNLKFKTWESLMTTKGRHKESLFILSGEKIISDFLKDNGPARFPVKSVLIPKNFALNAISSIQNNVHLSSPSLYFTLDTPLFKELDLFGTRYPLLICQKPDEKFAEHLNKPIGMELGLPLTDPANLGAICRTALSFNIRRIVLTPTASDPFHPKALRASSGATLKLDFTCLKSDETAMTVDDFGLDLDGESIYHFNWPKNLRLWLGEEGQGLKKSFLEKNKIYIPIQSIESLNSTVAGSIAVFSYSQRFQKI